MKKALFAASIFALPLVAFAAPQDFTGYISWVGGLINQIIPVMIGIALVVFFWGLIVYIANRGQKSGRDTMIAGLVALFIMVSVWGILRLAQNTFGVSNAAPVTIPQVPSR